MAKDLTWEDAIRCEQQNAEQYPDDYNCQLIWKRLQLGDRSQDLLQTIRARQAMKDDAVSQAPEWQQATKWLSWQRAQQSNLMLDMLWAQLESGNRTPELLTLIRSAANPGTAPPIPPPAPAPVVTPPPPIPEPPPPVPEPPPAKDF